MISVFLCKITADEEVSDVKYSRWGIERKPGGAEKAGGGSAVTLQNISVYVLMLINVPAALCAHICIKIRRIIQYTVPYYYEPDWARQSCLARAQGWR